MNVPDDPQVKPTDSEPDDPELRAAVAALPSPHPSRDLVAGAMTEAAERVIHWPRILKVAAVAAILMGTVVLLHQRTLPISDAPEHVGHHLADTTPPPLPETVRAKNDGFAKLDTRMRQARRRLRAIRRRNPDAPEDDTNNGAMRQEGARDEEDGMDNRQFAARSGKRDVHPCG